jgi:hypothetical protein
MKHLPILLAVACAVHSSAAPIAVDVVVYGGTSAGIVAAVQAKRMGRSVVVVAPERHLGGLSAGGLGWTDSGNKAVIGGLARDFYHRVWLAYQGKMFIDATYEGDLLAAAGVSFTVGREANALYSETLNGVQTKNARNEGDIQVRLTSPYPVDYQAIVPKRAECVNLLVPVCVSASHIAYGLIRMEPVFMILGHSAAAAAVLAIDAGCAVQDLPYSKLRARLLEDGQVLEFPPSR